MKVVALVSGGKDSCYTAMKCEAYGHDVVALANIKPMEGIDDADSYMYQTVGHEGEGRGRGGNSAREEKGMSLWTWESL